MGNSEFVDLKCDHRVLQAIAAGLTRYGPTGGEPDWLVSGVWLCAGDKCFLATATIEVLADGLVARGLAIAPPDAIMRSVGNDLPDVEARLAARGNGTELPAADLPPVPDSLTVWPAESYTTRVLIRSLDRLAGVHRVACALLFTSAGGRSLLVGADVSSLALVYSEDPALISRYRKDCQALGPADYLSRYAG